MTVLFENFVEKFLVTHVKPVVKPKAQTQCDRSVRKNGENMLENSRT